MDREGDDFASVGGGDLLAQRRDRLGDEDADETDDPDTVLATLRDRLGDRDDEGDDEGRPDMDDLVESPHAAGLFAEDAGFSGSAGGAEGWMSRLFEDDTAAAGSTSLAGIGSFAETDLEDGLNLPPSWAVEDAGGGFTGWAGFDLGG